MKTASLVFFYFGEESYLNRLAQETVPVRLAQEGYDRTVVLRHETNLGPFELAEGGDVVDVPTAENLVKQLNDLGAAGYTVDLYVFSHGWPLHFRTSKGTYGDNTSVSAAHLEANVKPLALRAVWQCNCYGSTMNPTWRKLGARVAAGTRLVNFYPTRFRGFAERWNAGTTFGTAVSQSDTALIRTPVHAYLLVDAAARTKEWEGNVLQAATVLGTNEAAERYFRRCWIGDDWQEGASGKQNANRSSTMLVDGDRTLVKG